MAIRSTKDACHLRNLAVLYVCCLALSACVRQKLSASFPPGGPQHAVHTIAIAPNGGVLADAISVKLLNYGLKVIDTGRVSNMMVRLNLGEVEVFEPQNLVHLKDEGIDGILHVKSVVGYDGRPNSASVKITSTVDGSVVAGVSWQNARAGAQGSPADGWARVDLEQAAKRITAALAKGLGI